MLGRPMPFAAVPCSVWLPTQVEDAYGNERPTYGDEPDLETTCCYAPGRYGPDTSDDIEEERPQGDRIEVTFFLPKGFEADLRGALIAATDPTNPWLSGRRFAVQGAPTSYMRANTPGDYSWYVRGVEFLG